MAAPTTGRRDDEPTTFCCSGCGILFSRPAGRRDLRKCRKCDPDRHPEERKGGGRSRLRPKDTPLNLGDKVRLKREEIETLNQKINRAVEAGDMDQAAELRDMLAYKVGQGPKPKPKKGKGKGKG